MTTEIVKNIVYGAAYGAVAGGVGYIKNEDWETFNPYKFLRTMIIGGIVGGIGGENLMKGCNAFATEFDLPTLVVHGVVMTGIVSLADQAVKVIARRTDLGKLWIAIKKFFNKRLE